MTKATTDTYPQRQRQGLRSSLFPLVTFLALVPSPLAAETTLPSQATIAPVDTATATVLTFPLRRTFTPRLHAVATDKAKALSSLISPQTELTKTPAGRATGTVAPFVIQGRVLPAHLLIPAAVARMEKKEKGVAVLSVLAGKTFLQRATDFSITRQQLGGQPYRWRLGDKGGAFTGLGLDIAVSDQIAYYGRIESHFYNDIELNFLSVGPKLLHPLGKDLTATAKAGVVYGRFKWDGPPGDFFNDFGWELGAGLEYRYNRFVLGFEGFYRAIDLEYDLPPDQNVTATTSSIDFKGFLLNATLGYTF